MDSANLKSRGADIAAAANQLANSLLALQSPEPSIEHGLPAPLRNEAPVSDASSARLLLLQQLDEMRALLTEPTLILTPELRNPNLSVHSIIRLGIAENFPPEGTSAADLGAKLNLREDLVRRLLAHCATHFIFYQQSQDFFVHTAASRALSNDDGMRKWILLGSDEILPATLKTATSLLKHPESEEPEQSAWCITNNTTLPIFKALANMPERAILFAGAMKYLAMLPGFSPHFLVSAFPFNASGETTVVDIGGSLGHVSQMLASANANVKCVVEDWPDVVLEGERAMPAQFRGRISFKAHDFFEAQPVHGADVYLLRLILHDWSDKYARKIIKALVPALKPGAKVVVNERAVPEFGQASMLKEREARDNDMYMLAMQNAKERTVRDWKSLFADVDNKFQVSNVHQPSNSALAIVEVTWNAEGAS